MIDEIKHALEIASAGQAFEIGEGGYLILTTEGVSGVEDGSALDTVLEQTFGDDYANTLKLSYGEWGNNALYLGLLGGGAASVYNSTYYGVSDVLMGQVKEITDAAMGILDIAGSGNNRNDMIALFAGADEAAGTSALLSEVAGMYGYVDEDGNGDISKVSDEELPNFLVLAVAYDITNEKYLGDEWEMSATTGLIHDFALFNGYAATEQGKQEGFDVAYNNFVAQIGNAQDVNAVANAYKTLRAEAQKEGSNFATYKNSQGETDSEAFSSMMIGLTSSTVGSNSEKVQSGLANDDFFTSGAGNALFGTYMDSVESFAGIEIIDEALQQEFLNAMSQPGAVGIFFTLTERGIVINSSLPVV